MAQAQLSRSDLLTTYFRNPEYLSIAPLNIDNVMPYFYDSPFFERSSNNGQLAMQATGQGTMITQKAMDESLRGLVGIEFAVVHARPPGLFVIHKRYRKSPDEVRPITAYYVLNGNINQAPDLHELIGNRLISTISSLRNSLSLARAAAMGGPVQNSPESPTVHRPGAAFNVRWGHGWRLNDSVDQPEEKGDDEDEDEDEEERQEKENPEEQKGEGEEDLAVQLEKEKENEKQDEKIEEQVQKIPEKVGGKKGKRSRDDEDSVEPSNTSTNTKQRRTAASSEKKRRTAR